MFMALVLAFAAALAQAPAAGSPQTPPPPGTPPEVPVLNARLGGCSAEFTVKNADGAPVYLALIHVNVRYGPLNVKRMDIEVGTNSDGKARIKGLPDKAKPMTYDVQKDDKKTTVDQDVAKSCDGKFEVTLK
jgi:hypothetical protein